MQWEKWERRYAHGTAFVKTKSGFWKNARRQNRESRGFPDLGGAMRALGGGRGARGSRLNTEDEDVELTAVRHDGSRADGDADMGQCAIHAGDDAGSVSGQSETRSYGTLLHGLNYVDERDDDFAAG